ncbi:hypothetical protein ABW20_dc0108389 [Dactylellina cionopaga]|nr:hypothetical protein ABW20_dc0108389 [Dactylellina cionopaga]
MSEKTSTQYELQSHLLASIGAWADQFAHGPAEGPGFNYPPMNDLMCSHCDPIAALQGGPYAYKPSPEIDLEPLERFLVEWRDRPIQESLLLLTTQFEELK